MPPLLVVVALTGAGTAALLVAALVATSDATGNEFAVVAVATAAFAAFVIAGTIWAAAMREGQEEARTLTGGRAELASMIAHELKNPMASIKGLAATGTRLYDSMSDEERLEFFKLIDDEASRLKMIAEETSTALKIDAGQLAYDIRPEALAVLVEEVVWQSPHGEHPLLVEAEPEIQVRCDRARIQEVLAHLLDNAVKFSPPDAPIEVRAYRGPHDQAIVEVADRGPGIPAEERERVFEKFARWRPASYEETPGAGLGLFICRAHLKEHGGTLDIEDGPDGGTILRFTLPIEG